MSEVKLNLTDIQQTIHGTIHGSIVDSCVAALSAEPETIAELEAALSRYIKPVNGISRFAWFRTDTEIDEQPWDAGIVIIDLGLLLLNPHTLNLGQTARWIITMANALPTLVCSTAFRTIGFF